MKYFIMSFIALLAFFLYTLFAPVFFQYHVDTYGIGEGGQFCMFWGFLLMGVVLLACIAAPILYLSEKE